VDAANELHTPGGGKGKTPSFHRGKRGEGGGEGREKMLEHRPALRNFLPLFKRGGTPKEGEKVRKRQVVTQVSTARPPRVRLLIFPAKGGKKKKGRGGENKGGKGRREQTGRG